MLILTIKKEDNKWLLYENWHTSQVVFILYVAYTTILYSQIYFSKFHCHVLSLKTTKIRKMKTVVLTFLYYRRIAQENIKHI